MAGLFGFAPKRRNERRAREWRQAAAGRGEVGWGGVLAVCSSEIVLRVKAGGGGGGEGGGVFFFFFLESSMENLVLFGCLCLSSSGKTTKEGRRQMRRDGPLI